jgi:glycosyltransferase involved in cell wall biosynthesis
VSQFLEHFTRRGISWSHHVGYGPEYNAVVKTRLGVPYKLACRSRRALLELAMSDPDADFLFFQRKAFRESSLPEELAARRNPRVIFDFDDSIFLGPDGGPHPMRQRAFDRMCALSAHIVCGNSWLAERAGAPHKTTVIPTVVDTDLWAPDPSATRDDDSVTIGWMGTASSFALVRAFIPTLEEVLAEHPHVRLHLVSNARAPEFEGHPQVLQTPWSAESEVDLLRSFDVGLMPLQDSLLTRGKCGFKMILYMAVGCPVVASAVGANVEILQGSGAGLLVEDVDGWGEALGQLITASPEESARMGEAARAHAVANYSVASVIDRYVEVFERVALGAH